MIHYGWPDIIIIVSVIISGSRGWKIGFITELAGTIAVVVAVFAAFSYPGWWDGFIAYWTRLSNDSAHIFAMFLFAISIYGIIALFALFLSKYAEHDIVSPIDAFGGALLGGAKAFVLYWIILYLALFMPLSRPLRSDLRNSFIVPLLTEQGDRLDDKIRPAAPWFARPLIDMYLRRHHL